VRGRYCGDDFANVVVAGSSTSHPDDRTLRGASVHESSHSAWSSSPGRRSLDNIGKQLAECREYHDRLHVVADKQIAFDLDDGVVANYAKFGDVVGKLK
jgi:hypothetical protein